MKHETFPVSGPVAAVVRVPAGSVEVDAVETTELDVTVEPLNDAARRAMDDVSLEFSGDRLLVDVGGGPRLGLFLRTPSFRVTVRAPHESRLDVATVSADLRADGRFGRLDAKTVSGDLSAGDVADDATVKTVSGDVKLGKVGGRVSANSVSGDLKVAEAARGVSAKTVSGDQSIDSITAGEAQLQSVSGDIRVGIQRGSGVWLDVRSASGKTVSELEPTEGPPADGPSVELRAKAVSGDIRIVRAA
jgi:putative adhesin